jgi:O-methyltransferase
MSLKEQKGFARKIKLRLKSHLSNKFGITISRRVPRGQEVFPSFVDPEFVIAYRRYSAYTMVPWKPLYWSWLAARHVALHAVPGDVVECGVYRGGCSIIMATAHDRQAWLYDTFTGMAEPGEFDFKGEKKGDRFDAKKRYEAVKRDGYIDWVYSSIDEVSVAIRNSEVDDSRFRLVKGKVEDTIPKEVPEHISLLRLDTDFYESTRHELEHLYPRLSPGGILIVDDYGSWAGSRKAVDEFLADLPLRPLMLPEGSSANVLLVKPS